MALDSSFYIESSQEPIQIRSWIINNLKFQEDETDDPIVLVKKGVVAIVDYYKPHFNVIEETYGFLPNISIYFRLDKFDGFDDGYKNMIDSVQQILKKFECQAIMLGPGGGTALLSMGGQLFLQQDEWNENNLKLFDLPYVVKEIRNM
jgi:hypothetical protein